MARVRDISGLGGRVLPLLRVALTHLLVNMAIVAATHDDGYDEDNDDEQVTPYLAKLSAVAGLGGLLFGFDTGVIGGILVVIGSDLTSCKLLNDDQKLNCVERNLTVGEESLIVSATTVGALVGSLLAGWLSDTWGRKRVITLAAVLFVLGALEQTFSNNVTPMTAGRLLVGVGVGLSSMVTPIYIAELSPARIRGQLVALLVVLITAGQLLAYVVDAIFYSIQSGWRWMSFTATLPALVQILFSFQLPESPRWFVSKLKFEEARETLRKLYPNLEEESIERRVKSMENSLRLDANPLQSRETSSVQDWKETLWRNKANRRALVLACTLQIIQQATGFNTLMYYSQKLLALEGFAKPSTAAIAIAISNLICTCIALHVIDRMGRRPLLLKSLIGMGFGHFCIGLTFLFIKPTTSHEGKTNEAGSWAYLSVLSMVGFCCSYALGLGNVPWIVQSEIFSYNVRAVGNSISTACNWTSNLIVSATFLPLTQAFSPTSVFWGFCIITWISVYFTYTCLPETKGLSLEEARQLFERDDLVHQSSRSSGEVGYQAL